MVVHACNLNSWEAKAERSQVQGQPGIQSDQFVASLVYKVRPSLKTNQRRRRRRRRRKGRKEGRKEGKKEREKERRKKERRTYC
jgi:hypothetical protein